MIMLALLLWTLFIYGTLATHHFSHTHAAYCHPAARTNSAVAAVVVAAAAFADADA